MLDLHEEVASMFARLEGIFRFERNDRSLDSAGKPPDGFGLVFYADSSELRRLEVERNRAYRKTINGRAWQAKQNAERRRRAELEREARAQSPEGQRQAEERKKRSEELRRARNDRRNEKRRAVYASGTEEEKAERRKAAAAKQRAIKERQRQRRSQP
jgi:hypothetical protein